MKGKVLLVSEDKDNLKLYADTLAKDGFSTVTAESPAQGVEILRQDKVLDAALVDKASSDIGRLGFLNFAKTETAATQVIIISDSTSVEEANKAMKMGAFEYIGKPVDSERILLITNLAVKMAHLARENSSLRSRFASGMTFEGILTSNREMMEAKERGKMLSGLATPLLISGETGSGRKSLAEAIHKAGPLGDGPFVFVGVAEGASGSFRETQIFGGESANQGNGSYLHEGLMEKASGGTLYISEIFSLDKGIQATLAKAIIDGEYARAGGKGLLKTEFRLIGSTCQNLARAVKEGIINEQLYSVFKDSCLGIPSLRKRKEDIPALANHFLKEFRRKNNEGAEAFSHEAMNAMSKYRWLGNVMELKETVESMAAAKPKGEIDFKDLPDRIYKDAKRPSKNTRADMIIKPYSFEKNSFEREYLVRALEECEGNITVMSRITDLSRPALYEKLRKHGLK